MSWIVATETGEFFAKSAGTTALVAAGRPVPYFDHAGRVRLLRNAVAERSGRPDSTRFVREPLRRAGDELSCRARCCQPQPIARMCLVAQATPVSMMRLSTAATTAEEPGASTVVDVDSFITAGPVIVCGPLQLQAVEHRGGGELDACNHDMGAFIELAGR